jgi:hypothetical protein
MAACTWAHGVAEIAPDIVNISVQEDISQVFCFTPPLCLTKKANAVFKTVDILRVAPKQFAFIV